MRNFFAIIILLFTFFDAQAQFTRSYTAGVKDAKGNFMGGTEMRVLANHKGQLFGGIETWMDDTTGTCDPFLGAQILRLETTSGQWSLDKHFNTFFPNLKGRERKRNEGITALESVIFRTDKTGKVLAKPDTILIAAARDFTGVLSVYTRNDASKVWTEKQIGTVPVDTAGSTDNDGTIRSLVLYRDKVTGIDRVFAGSLPNGIISGVYDASLQGKIIWDTQAELKNFVGRPMAFTVCNGDLYCAIAPNVWRRYDGLNPTWSSVYTYPFTVTPDGSSGLRGITTIKNPNGPGQALIAALEGKTSKIFRLTPGNTLPFAATAEYDVDAAMSTAFGYPGNYYVVANSEMTWVTEPTTGDSVLTITIQHHPANIRDDAYYLIRKQVGSTITYTIKRIDNTVFAPLTILNSTRAIVASPFPNDDNTIFIAGYDADNNISHNTAYILKATKSAFFNPEGSTKTEAGLKQKTIIPSLTDPAVDNTFGNHQTYLNTAVKSRNQLFLFFPGSNSSPIAYDGVQKLAANLGYHSLGISYSNATISPLCAGSSDKLCFDKVRNEVIDGVDRTNLVAVNAANSITNRVLKALQYLNAKFPNENWGQFYVGTTIRWDKIALAGHSQGGGHAALLAKQYPVARVVLLASPKDYFTAPLNRAAEWINQASATAACKYYSLVHQADNLGCTPTQQLEIFTKLGIDTFSITPAVYETSSGGNFNKSHVVLSALKGVTGSNAHNIVAVDVAAATICKVPYFSPVWNYLLTNESCLTSATISLESAQGIRVFPNPFSQSFGLQNVQGGETFVLSNSLGQVMYLGKNVGDQDFSLLPPGVYALVVYSKGAIGQQTIKLVKQ